MAVAYRPVYKPTKFWGANPPKANPVPVKFWGANPPKANPVPVRGPVQLRPRPILNPNRPSILHVLFR